MSHSYRLAKLYERAKEIDALDNFQDTVFELLLWNNTMPKFLNALEAFIELKEVDRLVKEGQEL